MMRAAVLLLCVLVCIAVSGVTEARRRNRTPGPCRVENCERCNTRGNKCMDCSVGFRANRNKKKCKPTPCTPNPCMNAGTCRANRRGVVRCDCPATYLGERCETQDLCNPDPCLNDAVCDAGICTCQPGFSGAQCQTAGPVPVLAVAGETTISHCNKIASAVTFDTTYRVSFQVKVNTYAGINVGQAMHITRGDSAPASIGGAPNDHQATMYILGSAYRYAPASDTAGGTWQLCMPYLQQQTMGCFNSPTRYSAGEWHTVVIEQVLEGEEYINRATVDGELHNAAQTEVVNTDPMAFGAADVYVSDCWTPTFDGEIRNLEIISPVE